MLRMPARTKRDADKEILFVYGHHSSLERWWGLCQVLNRYGAVTMPDLPGFGGMDSFYKLGRKPTIDNLADYLAAFIKLRYRRKKVIIAGLSFGFVVVTRMFQRYPELKGKVTLLVSIVGFAHHEDFTFSRSRMLLYRTFARLFSMRLPAIIFRQIALHPVLLRNFYGRTHNAKHKFAQAEDPEELELLKQVEVGLWHDNDVRTWAHTTAEFLKLDNCDRRVDLPVWHAGTKNDHYFDNHLVEQHMRVVFKEFHLAWMNTTNHAPSVTADEKAAAAIIPTKLRNELKRL